MNANNILKKLALMENLTEVESRELANGLMKGELTSTQIGAVLTALAIKGEESEEILGFSKGLRDNMVTLDYSDSHLIDTCGTGGDGLNTFNVSTVVAFVAAAAGIKVAKHGNRALSSKCGSADVLLELGIDITLSKAEASRALEEIGIAFLFAPNYHLAMKNVAKERKELAIRTIFNLVGPIVNPANLTGQLLGVSRGEIQFKLAEVLRDLGLKKALVVHGDDGLDEISICTTSTIYEVNKGKIIEYKVSPEKLGFKRANIEELKGGEAKENSEIILSILQGEKGAKRDMVLINSAAALYVGEKVKSLEEGVELAKILIDKGLALEKLRNLKGFKRD
ncbi:MAG: anthranilate phosphoribosyltransferase [Sarcina sp.]